MRVLGIDYGTRVIGLAVSDASGLIAQGIASIKRRNLEADLGTLQERISQYQAERIVVGLPKNMDGSLGKSAREVLGFVEKLRESLSVEVDTWDERLSTVEAERTMIHADMSRKKRKKVIDKVAAVIILQGYLDYLNRNRSV